MFVGGGADSAGLRRTAPVGLRSKKSWAEEIVGTTGANMAAGTARRCSAVNTNISTDAANVDVPCGVKPAPPTAVSRSAIPTGVRVVGMVMHAERTQATTLPVIGRSAECAVIGHVNWATRCWDI
jgi:hypothetical protein